jgi:hypothetical protein
MLICFILFSSALREEMKPDNLPDRSAVASFDQTKLKHVETTEKNVIPSKDGRL